MRKLLLALAFLTAAISAASAQFLSPGERGRPNLRSQLTLGATDTVLTRAGPATWQLGRSDAAVPVAQVLQVQSVAPGTSNTAGTNWTFVGSKGTGTGAGGKIIFNTAPAGSSGTLQNAASSIVAIDQNGQLGLGTASPGFIIDAEFNTNSAPRIHLQNASNGTSAQTLYEGQNDNAVAFQMGITSSTFTGANGASTTFLQHNPGSPAGALRLNTVGVAVPVVLATNNIERVRVTDIAVQLISAQQLNWNADTILVRAAAAALQFGAADAAAPVAQITQVQSVVAGTSNTAGTNWTLIGSKGTGTGAGGNINLQTAPAGSSGTSQNSASTVASLQANGHVAIGFGAPTANSCAGFALGTGSSDAAGQVTYTSATTCSITFQRAYTNAPFCQITPGSAPSTNEVVTTTGGFTATFGTAQTAFYYACFGT